MAGFNDSGGQFGAPFGQSGEDPFGQPFGQSFGDSPSFGGDFTNQPASTNSGYSSYVTAQVEDSTEHLRTKMTRVSIVNSPWPVWVAAVGYLAGTIQSILVMVHAFSRDTSYVPETLRNAYWTGALVPSIFILAIGIGVFAVLKAQAWGRILLTVISVSGIFLIVWGNMWITTFLLAGSAVFLWLPRNARWFGFRKKY